MKADKSRVVALFEDKALYVTPEYQRAYCWGKKECERLWNDMIDAFRYDRKHFIGSILEKQCETPSTKPKKYFVIDGQQRITTIYLMLIALRDSIKDVSIEENELLKKNVDLYLRNLYQTGDEEYKLILTKKDKKILIDLVNENPDKDGNSPIYLNYKWFCSKIQKGLLTPEHIHTAITKLEVAVITLDNDDNEQAIFESINSTGKQLAEFDLVRNYILMNDGSGNDQHNLYEGYWRPFEELFEELPCDNKKSRQDDFLRNYLIMKLQTKVVGKDVYEKFKKFYVDAYSHRNISKSELCKDLKRHAQYYCDALSKKSENKEIQEIYEGFAVLKIETLMPFLLKAHYDWDSGVIDEKTFIEVLKICISYSLRVSVCEKITHFDELCCTILRGINKDKYVDSLLNALCYRARIPFPSDEDFRSGLITEQIGKKQYCNYILRSIENSRRKTPITGDYTTERILPLKPEAEWKKMLGSEWEEIRSNFVEKLGNLTLTVSNSELRNKPFLQKRDMEKHGYRSSGLNLDEFVIKQDKWNEEKISERSRSLATWALEIWPKPPIKDKYTLDSYNMNESTRKLYEDFYRELENYVDELNFTYNQDHIAFYYKGKKVFTITPGSRSLKFELYTKKHLKDTKGLCKTRRQKRASGYYTHTFTIKKGCQPVTYVDFILQAYEQLN